MLRLGAPPDARDDELDTPLHVAVEEAQEGLVRLLLDGGADVDARNNYRVFKNC